MTCDQGCFLFQQEHSWCFQVLDLFWEWRVSFSQLLQGWSKQKNEMILCNLKWDVVLCHTWLFRMLLSSITEKTIWGNNGPCRSPISQFSAPLVGVSVSYSILQANIFTYNTVFLTYLLPSVSDIWNYCNLSAKPHHLQEISDLHTLKKTSRRTFGHSWPHWGFHRPDLHGGLNNLCVYVTGLMPGCSQITAQSVCRRETDCGLHVLGWYGLWGNILFSEVNLLD